MAFNVPRKPLARPNYQQVAPGEHWDDNYAAEHSFHAPPESYQHRGRDQPHSYIVPNINHEADVSGTLLVNETQVQHADMGSTLSMRRSAWNPIWLRKTFLVGVAVTFLAMLAATTALFVLSQARNGLSTPNASWHYAWTYGPTAVFILSTAVWFMVDTSTRTLMPWLELRRGPSPGSKSVALDYLSPIVPLVWWRAVRNGHWAVVLTVTGYALLNLGTVFASGLLALRPTTFAQPVSDLTTSLRLDASKFQFNNTMNPVTAAPAVNYYGIRLLALERPTETTDDLVVVPVSLADDIPAGVNYSAIVPGFRSELNCEEVSVGEWKREYLPWLGVNDIYWTTNFSLLECHIERVILGKAESTFYLSDTNATETFVGLSGDYICNAGMAYNGMDKVPFIDSTAVHKKLLTVAHFTIADEEFGKNATVTRVTAVACDQGYSINRYRTTYASRPGQSPLLQSTELVEETNESLKGYTPADAGVFTEQAVAQMSLSFGGEDAVLSQVKPMYQFMSQLAGNVTMSAFMDAEFLIKYAAEVTKGVSTHLTREYLMLPDDSQIPGEIVRTEERLWAQVLSTGILCGVLAVMAGLCVVHVFIRPHDVVSSDPGSLVSIACTLAVSAGFLGLIRGMGAWRDKEIHNQIDGIAFRAQTLDRGQHQAVVAIEPSIYQASPEISASENTVQHMKWWYPQAATIWFFGLAIIVPLAVIAALEAIQSISDKDNGFDSLGKASSGFDVDAEMVSRYLPVLLALCIAAAYSSLEFAATTLARYLPLRQVGGSATEGACASRTIAFDVAGKTLPSGLYASIKERHFGLSAIMIGAFIGHFLTIVSAGLYKAVDRPQVLDITFERVDSFDLPGSANLLLDDNQAASLTNLIEFSGLDFPQWTYDDLVFHALSSSAESLNLVTRDSHATVKATLPATRAKLDCKAMEPSSRRLLVIDDGTSNAVMVRPGMLQSYGSTPYYALVEVNSTLPWSLCDRHHPDAPSATTSPWTQYFMVPISLAGIHVGMATQLSWWKDRVMGNGAIPPTSFAIDQIAQQADLGCPSLAVTLGSLTVTNGTDGLEIDSDLGTLLCYQHVEEVSSTAVTFTLPGMNISTSNPPVPDNSTAQLLSNPKLGGSSKNFEFSLNHAFSALDSDIGEDDRLAPSIPEWNDIDKFLRMVLSRNAHDGRTELQVLESMAGSGNTAVLFDALQPFYGRYMAQAISQNMRVTDGTSDSSSSGQVQGTLTLPSGQRRLVQERGPKLALQIMLAVMVVAAVVMQVSMRGMRRTLPHNPLSIVGAATLLANGGWVGELAKELDATESVGGVKIMQANVTEMKEKATRETEWFADRVFSMGWWESTSNGGESVFAVESWRK